VNPIGNRRTLSGVFKATRNRIFFYDFRQANYISGMTAKDLVEGRLPKPAAGIYDAEMPLLIQCRYHQATIASHGMCPFIGVKPQVEKRKPSIWRVSP